MKCDSKLLYLKKKRRPHNEDQLIDNFVTYAGSKDKRENGIIIEVIMINFNVANLYFPYEVVYGSYMVIVKNHIVGK